MENDHAYLRRKGDARLWFALLGAAALWFVAQTINYFVVPWSCSHEATLPLHIITALTVAGIGLAGWTGYRIWRAEGGTWSGDHFTHHDRSRFIAELGMGLSALFALLMIGLWASIIMVGPCIPLPRVPFTPDAFLSHAPILLAHPGAALQPHDLWRAWTADPAPWLTLLWAGVPYGAGLRYAPRRIRVRAFAFAAGCVALLIALVSPLHALSETLFSAHMVQHTLLIAVAAPLIVLGRPLLVSLWAFPRHVRRAIARHPVTRAMATVSHITPVQAFAVHAVSLWIWHVPVLYEAGLANELVHVVQHVTFVLSAILFWHAVLDVRGRHSALGAGVLYTFGTAVHTSVLGALITLAPVVWYPAYGANTRAWGMSPLEDQQLAGLIMWVPGGLLYTAVAILMLGAWLRQAERRQLHRGWVTATSIGAVFIIGSCDLAAGTTRTSVDARTAAGLTLGAANEGRRSIERYGCGGCHEIKGVKGANGLVGPPLNGIGKRMYIGGVLTNTPENMVRWIVDPQAVDSLTVMPRLGVTTAQVRDMAAYLYTLK